MPWPALGPILNQIENLWGVLSRRVFQGGMQSGTLGEWKKRVEEDCSKLEDDLCHILATSMTNCCNATLEAIENSKKYQTALG